MNVQEVLENYNVYKLRISITSSEIQEIQAEIYDLKSANMDGLPKAKGYTKSQLEEAIINAQEKIEEKQRYKDELQNKIKIVDLQGNSTVLELLHKNNSIGGLILCYINE